MKKRKLAKLKRKVVALKTKIEGGRGTLQDVIELVEIRSVVESKAMPQIPKTNAEVSELKEQLMKSYDAEQDPAQKEMYAKAVMNCDILAVHIRDEGKKRAETKRKRDTTGKAKSRFGFLLVLLGLSLCLLLGGCKVGGGIGLDGELFWPNIKKKVVAKPDGTTTTTTGLSDPEGSREQSTQHTTGMARNNLPMVGGD